jgi:cysteinyl-tRNA synthetase
MYVCGLTPQGSTHVGHARTFVVFDVLKRVLEFKGFNVLHVQNFTDIDDKIITKAKELGIQPSEVAEKYTVEYFEVMDKLNVKRAQLYPKVTEHIEDILHFIERLIEKGKAYVSDGDVYFDVSSFPEYGKLSHQKVEELIAGARVEPSEKKRSPEDFALWKAVPTSEVGWLSPWGKGRPGWHIECSTLSIKYLGETLDIHGGGQDLIFPHHENEIAQSEALTGKPFARFWVHVGYVTMGNVKMSKSVGNVINLIDLLKEWNPNTIRLALLGAHYRSPLEFNEDVLRQAGSNISKIENVFSLLATESLKTQQTKQTEFTLKIDKIFSAFVYDLENDLDLPNALSKLFEAVRVINKAVSERECSQSDLKSFRQTLERMCELIGIRFEKIMAEDELVRKLISLLLEIREEARKRKDYQIADRIRLELAQLGVIVEDTPFGPRWKIKNQ